MPESNIAMTAGVLAGGRPGLRPPAESKAAPTGERIGRIPSRSLASAAICAESARRQSSPEGGCLAVLSAFAGGVRRARHRVRRVRDHRWIVAAVAAVVSVVFVFHFSMIGLYLLPLNPVKLAFNRYLVVYVDPLFYQNWHLFAPDPINSNQSVIGMCRADDVESDWFDITHGVIERLKDSPIASALSSVLHLQQNLIRAYLFGSSESDEISLIDFCRDQPDAQYCRDRDRRMAEEKAFAIDALVRLVTDVCVTNGFPDVDSVYLRLADLAFPRFSSRSLPDEEGEVRYIDIDWQPSALRMGAE